MKRQTPAWKGAAFLFSTIAAVLLLAAAVTAALEVPAKLVLAAVIVGFYGVLLSILFIDEA